MKPYAITFIKNSIRKITVKMIFEYVLILSKDFIVSKIRKTELIMIIV